MKIIHFSCELLSDIIINQKAATEGNQETLDFIPGNNFLGITAGQLYNNLSPSDQILVFHSGKVRFGDAHPASNNLRSLHVPAIMYHPKLKKINDESYIYTKYDRKKDTSGLQLKQCRKGFYIFNNGEGISIGVSKSFSIKSAYDRENRRSKDMQMYGYQSIDKGTVFIFEIAADNDVNDEIISNIKTALIGIKRVGRSRTAQFGLVEITEIDNSTSINNDEITTIEENYLYAYADGRLIFLDEFGLPTFTPEAIDLGITEGSIDWEKSQIRTFSYAPWNFKRQARDTDRCGIEKGSVFAIKTRSSISLSFGYVGKYQNEGFGKILYNPWFLKSLPGTNGKSACKIQAEKEMVITDSSTKQKVCIQTESTPLINYLKCQKEENIIHQKVYEEVNSFIDRHSKSFTSQSFASQWGSIRSLALQYPSKKQLEIELFSKTVIKDGKPIPFAYLTHGVAKDKWEDRNRKNVFKDFFDQLIPEYAQFAIVNLAAEMAKKCKSKK